MMAHKRQHKLLIIMTMWMKKSTTAKMVVCILKINMDITLQATTIQEQMQTITITLKKIGSKDARNFRKKIIRLFPKSSSL